MLRHLGLATRFVSGYLIQLKPDVKSLDGPSGAEADFTDLHAWCEVYLPGASWIGLDPTSGLFAGEGHIPLACSPEPGSAAPVSGAVDKCEVAFEHQMEVSRVLESPRVTPPYSEAQWAAGIDAWAARWTPTWWRTMWADHGRRAHVCRRPRPRRRRMEHQRAGPTSAATPPSWCKKLCACYGAGGFCTLARAKWYPASNCRALGAVGVLAQGRPASWRNPALFADERLPSHYTPEDASRLSTR